MDHRDAKLLKRGFYARLFHAVVFEITAIVLTSLFFVIFTNKNWLDMGILSAILSLIATLWNGFFNFCFDALQKALGFSRTILARVAHAVCFEGGLVLFTVPLVAFYLGISFGDAFLLEAGLVIFFLFYSFAFNFIYDRLYIRFTRD